MNVERRDRDSVTLILQPDEARRLLTGMREHAQALGAVGQELERELSAVGVAPLAPARIRGEYMPPLAHG